MGHSRIFQHPLEQSNNLLQKTFDIPRLIPYSLIIGNTHTGTSPVMEKALRPFVAVCSEYKQVMIAMAQIGKPKLERNLHDPVKTNELVNRIRKGNR